MLSSLGFGLAGVSPVVAAPKEAPSVFVPDAGAEADKPQNAAPAFEEILLVTATARKESSGDLPWVTEQLDAQVLLADELSSRDRADVQRIPPRRHAGLRDLYRARRLGSRWALDRQELYTAGEGELRYRSGYFPVDVDLSQQADGGSHQLLFEASTSGVGGTPTSCSTTSAWRSAPR